MTAGELCSEIIALCSEIHANYSNKPCGQSAELSVGPGGMQD